MNEASHNHRIIFNSFISITLVEEVLQYSLKVAFEKKIQRAYPYLLYVELGR